MSSTFICAVCGVPGPPQDDFEAAVKQRLGDLNNEEVDDLLRTLEDWNPSQVRAWEDAVADGNMVSFADLIAEEVISAFHRLRAEPRDMTTMRLAGRLYWVSGGMDDSEPWSFGDIGLLAMTGLDVLGNEASP